MAHFIRRFVNHVFHLLSLAFDFSLCFYCSKCARCVWTHRVGYFLGWIRPNMYPTYCRRWQYWYASFADSLCRIQVIGYFYSNPQRTLACARPKFCTAVTVTYACTQDLVNSGNYNCALNQSCRITFQWDNISPSSVGYSVYKGPHTLYDQCVRLTLCLKNSMTT
jgi:hypothetical protein